MSFRNSKRSYLAQTKINGSRIITFLAILRIKARVKILKKINKIKSKSLIVIINSFMIKLYWQ